MDDSVGDLEHDDGEKDGVGDRVVPVPTLNAI